MSDQSKTIQQQIHAAAKSRQPLRIEGNNTKAFLGNRSRGDILSTAEHTGVINYDASELVITVRSGTTVAEINAVLAEHNQALPFEPPVADDRATIGGTIACNLSGPARPYTGAARDFVLGAKIINGKAEELQFGGQVMKNVAGYDASRLMAGAYGTLGVMLEVSLKVLPRPVTEITLRAEMNDHEAIMTMNQLAAKNIPLTASCFYNNQLYLRLQSSENNTKAHIAKLIRQLEASPLEDGPGFWASLREQQHDFFNSEKTLWRLSLPPTNTNLSLPGEQLFEWGGALRWYIGDASESHIRDAARAAGGHATAYKNVASDYNNDVFQPLTHGQKILHLRLKQAFDPRGILNPDRLYFGM